MAQVRPLTGEALFYAAAASTLIAGVLHLAIVPMFFTQMSVDTTIFFVVSGLAQIFWVIPVIKRWSKPWYYVGIGGTVILIIMKVNCSTYADIIPRFAPPLNDGNNPEYLG